MQSVVKHEIIEAGATFKREYIYSTTAGDLVDLTGWVATMRIKESIDDVVAVLSPDVTVDDTTSRLSYTLTPADTALLESGIYIYAIEIAKDGEVIRLVEGNLTISPEVVK